MMQLSVLTPDQEYFKGEIVSLKVPGTGGQFQILQNHAPIVSALGEGEVTVAEPGGKKMKFRIKGGFLEVLNNNVSLLVQGIEE